MLNSSVLVLNRVFVPVHVTSLKRAFTLLYLGVARAVNSQFETFDFDSWSAVTASREDETIGLVGRSIKVPRVILLLAYDRVPKRDVRFSRINIFARDKNRCQYCGNVFPKNELNFDHVFPRSRGGKSTWENVVTCCIPCNSRKGGRTPEEAGMRLLSMPKKPNWTPFANPHLGNWHSDWLPFLDIVDVSYWHTELKE
jgi:5-methylcytosine-specific restriction endonuclease McrA